MSTFNALQAVEADVLARFADLPLEELRAFTALAAGPGPSAKGESGSPERIVAVATMSAYRERYAASVRHLPCETLAALCATHTDAQGNYASCVASAESDAIQYNLIERRHDDEMRLAEGLPSALVATVAPCANHYATGARA